MALAAKEAGYKAIIVPYDNRREASVVNDINVLPVTTLSQVVALLTGFTRLEPEKTDVSDIFEKEGQFELD
jgi:magnesium chelatase family protein